MIRNAMTHRLLVLLILSLPSVADAQTLIPEGTTGTRKLFPVRIGDFWGYIDRTGSIRIPPQFTSAQDFGPDNEPAPAQMEQLWGIIDTNGRWICHPVGLEMMMRRDRDGRILYQYYDTTSWDRAFIDTGGRPVLPLWRQNKDKERDPNATDTQYRVQDSTEIPEAIREQGYDEVRRVTPNRYILTYIKTGERYYRTSSQIVDSSGTRLLPFWVTGGTWPRYGMFTFSPNQYERDWKSGAAILDTTGRVLFDSSWVSLQPVSPDYVLVGVQGESGGGRNRNRYGIMSVSGEILTPPTATDIHFIDGSDSLFIWTGENRIKSIITPTGGHILEPGPYTSAELIGSGIVRVTYDSEFLFTMIDKTFSGTGVYLSAGSDVDQNFFYDYIDSEDGGWANIMRLRQRTGEVRFQLDSLAPGSRIVNSDFGEHMIAIRNDEAAYFYDVNGSQVLGPYADAYGFRDGLAPVCAPDSSGNLRWSYIDAEGRFIFPPQFDTVAAAGKDLLAVAERREGRRFWGFVDRTGRWVVFPTFDGARSFRDGRGAVMMYGDSGKVMVLDGCFIRDERYEPLPDWGFIDAFGSVVVPIRFSWVSDFSNGFASADTRGEADVSGVIDLLGHWVFDSTKFRSIGTFREGLATATDQETLGGRTHAGIGYIDAAGNWVISPRYDAAGPFHNGYAVVSDSRLTTSYLYMTLEGEVIWDGRYPVSNDGAR